MYEEIDNSEDESYYMDDYDDTYKKNNNKITNLLIQFKITNLYNQLNKVNKEIIVDYINILIENKKINFLSKN